MRQRHCERSKEKIVNCPLCNRQTAQIITNELRRGRGTVYYCEACCHGFLQQPDEFDFKFYYAEQYRQEYSHLAEESRTNAQEIFDVYKKFQQERLRYIEGCLTESQSLLEIGASAGQFLVHIRDKVKEVNAIELDNDCCSFMVKKLEIDADNEVFEKSRFSRKKYDIICTFQVLEHVKSPVDFLKTIREATKVGGLAFIEVPNLNDPLLSVWGVPEYKKFFFHNAHLHYFTETSLFKAAKDAGYAAKQIKINYTQDYNILNHMHWLMNNNPQPNCLMGLGDLRLAGLDSEISNWLTEELRELNRQYCLRLISTKRSSNMIMTLINN